MRNSTTIKAVIPIMARVPITLRCIRRPESAEEAHYSQHLFQSQNSIVFSKPDTHTHVGLQKKIHFQNTYLILADAPTSLRMLWAQHCPKMLCSYFYTISKVQLPRALAFETRHRELCVQIYSSLGLIRQYLFFSSRGT